MTRTRSGNHFDAELGRAARSLATEPLPSAILEVPLPASLGRPAKRPVARAWGLLGATLACGLLLIGIGFARGALRVTTPPGQPAFASTATLAAALRAAGWTCSTPTGGATRPRSPLVNRPDALICQASPTIHPVVAAFVIDESVVDIPSGVTIKADILGAPTSTDETRRSDLLYYLVGLPFDRADDAAAARRWLHDQGTLLPGDERTVTIAAVDVRYAWMTGGGDLIEIGRVATPH